jgi:RND family efflux transporter MFP subunit
MKSVWNWVIILALIAGAGVVGYFAGHRAGAHATEGEGGGDAGDDNVEATPVVQTAVIRSGHVDRKITAFGIVAAPAGDETVLSVAYESRVKKILVTAGQRLDAAAPAIELEPSPDTQLQLLQARAAVQAATLDLKQTQQRFNDHLATNQELLQSQQNLQQAQLKLDSMLKEGAGEVAQIKAAGLVAKIDVQEGQVVPAGSPLIELSAGGRLPARLGVEPSDASALHVGDDVALSLLRDDATPITGKVQMIAQRINPDTRLTDVFVSIPGGSALPLDAYVRGEITLAAPDGLVVPRSAVLPNTDDPGFSLFTVDGGKAAQHKVTVIAQNDTDTEISGDGLAAGQSVVVLGNLELEDGMSVKVGGQAEDSPATQADAKSTAPPATQETAQ